MAESKDPNPNDEIQLLGFDGVTPLKDLFIVVQAINKVSFKVRDKQTGVVMNVHRSRVARVVRRQEPQQEPATALAKEDSMPDTENATAAVAEQPKAAEKAAPEKAEKPVKAKAEAKAEAKEKKAPKQPPKPVPFDLKGWIKEHGGIHLSKSVKFDHSGYKLVSHVAVDDKGGFYHTVNTYQYPDGTVSLGKKGAGGNKYPLKGHRLTRTIKTKKGEESLVHKGGEDAAEVVARYEKKGYKKE
jgi:hypothetical protein